MNFFEHLKNRLKFGKTVEVSVETIEKYIDAEEMNELCNTEFFILVAESIIANIISGCTFRTCINGKEVKGEDYYTWNYEPNDNQSGTELKKAIVGKLLSKNECLIIYIYGQLWIADNYLIENESGIKEKIFYDVVVGTDYIPKKFKMSEVIYIKMNNRNITRLLNSVNAGYKRIAKQAVDDYEKANGRKGLLHINTMSQNKTYNGKPFSEIYEDLLQNRFAKYFKEKNAVLPLFEGFEYEEPGETKQSRSENKATDYKLMINEAASKVGLAYNIPPKFMTGEVEGMGDAVSLLLSICIDPMAGNIETGINRAYYKKAVLKGSYLWIDTSSILHIDLFAVAEKIDKLISSGMCNIDELRTKARMLELNTEFSKKHFITKNYEEMKEGGEEYAKNNNE